MKSNVMPMNVQPTANMKPQMAAPVEQQPMAKQTSMEMLQPTVAVTSQFDTVASTPVEGYSSEMIAMTTTGSVDEQLQSEIEDMISQLNFSAFSIEMDSVEQISPDFARDAMSAAELKSQEADMVNQEYIFEIRREEEPHTIPIRAGDDDRDMLVIEEEVPASVRNQAPAIAAPSMGTVSYPDLFQQLRH